MKNYFDTLSQEEQQVAIICSNLHRTFTNYARTSVLKIEPGGKMKMWCCHKTYNVLIVPKSASIESAEGFDLVASDINAVVDFFTKKTNDYLRDIAA